MIKAALLSTALLIGTTSAFSPSTNNGRLITSLKADAIEKSQALPFLNRPPLVSISQSG